MDLHLKYDTTTPFMPGVVPGAKGVLYGICRFFTLTEKYEQLRYRS